MRKSSKIQQNNQKETVDPFEMKSFFDQITSLLIDNQEGLNKKEELSEILSMNGECRYIIDYKKKKVLARSGFKSLLGYEDDEIDFDFVFKGYHHEDAVMVKQIIKSVVNSTVTSLLSDPDLQLSMTYRRKRKDGSYIHILSVSTVYELDKYGGLLKSSTRLMDISYLNLSTPVSWSIRSEVLEENEVRRSINALFENPFTKREIDVIKEIHKGGSNREIADRLCVSHHTIATHRKNIFRKSNCNSVLELLVYCKKLEIL